MYGPNVFMVLTAYDRKNKASSAIALEHNAKWFCKAVGGVAEEPTIASRETTPAEDSRSDHDDEASVVDRIVVTVFHNMLCALRTMVCYQILYCTQCCILYRYCFMLPTYVNPQSLCK